jgi:glutaredoxin|tara:strand:- start:378 stop:626 length:249 start_codon:yes stop_codon:yes gene_type:complete
MFTIYGKDECPLCYKVKTVFEMLGTPYVYKKLDTDYTTEEFQEKFPDTLDLPQVVMDGKHIGNANQTLKYLKEHRVYSNDSI